MAFVPSPRLRSRGAAPALIASLSLGLLGGCAGCIGSPALDDGGVGHVDAGDAGSEASECRTIALGDIGLDVQRDVETIYSAPLETELGSDVEDYLVFNFVNYNERVGPLAVGTFSLSEPPNHNRGPCAECLSVFQDQLTESSAPSKVFFQSAGSIRLDEDPRTLVFRGRVTGLELVEVSIDSSTLESTVVEGGECLRVEDFDIDYKHIPPEWTCDAAIYGSGGACNCDCGAPDPDCFCDAFMNDDCPDVIEDDCGEGSTCTYDGCRATCDTFSEPAVGCQPGELCVFNEGGQVCEGAAGRADEAALGESCTGESAFVQYCAIDGTVPQGMCDDFDATCQPLCRGTDMCPVEETCFTVSGGGPENGGSGYCRPEGDDPGGGGTEAPAGWECPAEMYADGTICECACGVPDPDCDNPENEVLGCEVGQTCTEGACG